MPTFFATGYMANILPHGGKTSMEIIVLAMFVILFAWISIGFWTALAGWTILMRGSDKYAISIAGSKDEPAKLETEVRTAIVMPIYNEDVMQVSAGLSATIESLLKTGAAEQFDFFILSDPGDPEIWVQEEMAWADLRHRYQDTACNIYYRQRDRNDKRKSGNIADFCRNWGSAYRYMIVLDADSVIRGDTIIRLVKTMERRPEIGILQTPPKLVNKESLLARTQQFASGLYGTMFAAGLNFWQLGDSQFWGHNAIIRVEPFMGHCDLPRLPGKPPLGGDILSHDFVEAALMRSAGYEVWLAYDLDGSYEAPPPSLLNELKRDNRWCQGNLQHLRLLFKKGIRGFHRALFVNGAMAYGSALLWFLFLAASSIMAILQNIREPDYFPGGRSLFPEWPVWEPQWAFVLLASTGIVLFLPKIFSVLYVLIKKRQAYLYGGPVRLVLSFFLEILISTLLAPTRMLFHAKFVFFTLLGKTISWEAQERGDVGTSWRDAIRFHLGGTVFALGWGIAVFIFNPAFFWWLSPILISLLISIPLSVWLSRRRTGLSFRKLGLMLIPEEVSPPVELQAASRREATGPFSKRMTTEKGQNAVFIRAVVNPQIYSLHMRMLDKPKASTSASDPAKGCSRKALAEGPQFLDRGEMKEILRDPNRLAFLHRKAWELSDPELSMAWHLPI